MAVARRSRLAPAVVVPDELSLTMWGHDPSRLALTPCAWSGRAEQLLLAEPLPRQLQPALEQLRAQLPDQTRTTTVEVPLTVERPEPDREGDADAGEHSEHMAKGDDGDHDHHDMMAIVGEPSADGLVMEPIRFRHGPLAPGLPGGLALTVELDGDVVADCRAEAQLAVEPVAGPQGPLDPLARIAWTVLIDSATEQAGGLRAQQSVRWRRLAAVELERALSHAAWLRCMGRLLGWSSFVDQAQAAVTELLVAQPEVALGGTVSLSETDRLAAARQPLVELRQTATHSGALRRRLAGRGRVLKAGAPGLQGPNARAGGQPRDGRSRDPLYQQLGFETLLESDADALARTRLRAREAVQAVELAIVAQEQAGQATQSAPVERPRHAGVTTVEGPRGPLIAAYRDRLRMSAPGTQAALSAAGRAAVGHEWSAALVSVASFDLSPWQVPG